MEGDSSGVDGARMLESPLPPFSKGGNKQANVDAHLRGLVGLNWYRAHSTRKENITIPRASPWAAA